MTETPTGFLVVDKPGGITSHDAVARVRRAVGIRKVGHAGTLDPMATGAVVCALGPATRLIRYIQDQPKLYRTLARFGEATDSLDADGEVVWSEPMKVTRNDVEGVLDRFLGEIEQVPPMVSAVKVGGERLYRKARRGEEVEREARLVRVDSIEVLSFGPGDFPEVEFEILCGKGTYVRVLADDIAVALGGRAHLRELRRLAVGDLDVSGHGIEVDRLEDWQDHLVPPRDALGAIRQVRLDGDDARAAGQGRPLPLPEGIAEDLPVAVLDDRGGLVGVFRARAGKLRPEVVLPEPA